MVNKDAYKDMDKSKVARFYGPDVDELARLAIWPVGSACT